MERPMITRKARSCRTSNGNQTIGTGIVYGGLKKIKPVTGAGCLRFKITATERMFRLGRFEPSQNGSVVRLFGSKRAGAHLVCNARLKRPPSNGEIRSIAAQRRVSLRRVAQPRTIMAAAEATILPIKSLQAVPRTPGGKRQIANVRRQQVLNSGRFSLVLICLLYTSPSPRDKRQSRMPSSA